MNTVKNLHLLSKIMTPEQVNRIEAGANLHKRHANIGFKILNFDGNKLMIQTKQGKHLSKNYADENRLKERTLQLFKPLVPDFIKIEIIAVPYVENPISSIDSKWLEQKMQDEHLKIKNIAEETGLDKTNISAWLNNKRPMSQITRAFFYFYFKTKHADTPVNISQMKGSHDMEIYQPQA